MAAMDRDAILAQIRLQTLVESTNVTDAEIVLLINNGVDEVSLADYWPFLEASATMTAVDSTRSGHASLAVSNDSSVWGRSTSRPPKYPRARG